ncbi:hypothetical protein A7M93_19150 [Acinetobacter baumannii]|nr:hypothetical protein A7M93_19150 [Acinetobacter baumannii]
MSASMEMLRARLIDLLMPHLSCRYVKWREAYFTWFTKCGGDSGCKCKACKGFGFIRDAGWGHIDKCDMCDAVRGASHE